jgi:hypothetical protein
MTKAIAPQEDRVDFPRSWERFVKPTRSTGTAVPVELRAEAGGLLYAEHATWLRAALDTMGAEYGAEWHQRLKPAALAFLDGAPDPLGAAVATVMICHRIGGNQVTTDYAESKEDSSRAMFHRLIAAHGLPFAAETAALFFTLDSGMHGQLPRTEVRGLSLVYAVGCGVWAT